MAIRVGKKWEQGAYYVGRPSTLGNPFAMRDEGQRDEVCDKYKAWFDAQHGKPEFDKELAELQYQAAMAAQHGRTLVLGCYCAPKRCHADTIKEWLEANPL